MRYQAVTARHYSAEDILRSGLRVTIRAARPDDRPRTAKAFGEPDHESSRVGSFSRTKKLSNAESAWIAEIDFVNEVMLVATMRYDGDEIVIGSACYVANDMADGTREARVAFTIGEPYQGLGIASQLLKHLAAIARLYGITRLAADVLPDNESMSTLFERSGLPLRRQRLDDLTRVTLALAGPPQAGRFPASLHGPR